MIQQLTFAHPDGAIESVPCLQLQINPKQQVAVIGFDFDQYANIEPFSLPDVKIERMGKLTDAGFMMEAQLTNSLYYHNWDFEMFPNPSVVLLTDKRILN